MKRNKILLILSIFLIIFFLIALFALFQSKNSKFNNSLKPQILTKENSSVPTGLSLPFNIIDINENNGDINPIGVYRFSKDTKGRGHSGLDIPLIKDSEIYAVADGEIILIESTGDQWGGMKMYQLLEQTGDGEGWIYNYDHVTPAKEVVEGKIAKRGELIATKTPPSNFTAHFELSKIFNNFQYTKDNKCWPDLLNETDNRQLNSWWNSYKTTEKLKSGWSSNTEEGKYPFKGLLDITTYPDGPMLCYLPGTDVR